MIMTKKNTKKRTFKAKGLARQKAILDAAHDVFKKNGYYATSVSQISRHCNMAMGTFYQYFKNKEEVFVALNDDILSKFKEKSSELDFGTSDFQQRFRSIIELLFHHINENFSFHCTLGESELVDRLTTDYYETLVAFFVIFFKSEMNCGNIRKFDPCLITYCLIGICYFNSMNWAHEGNDCDKDSLIDFIVNMALKGIGGPKPWEKPGSIAMMELPSPGEPPLGRLKKMTKGEKTRRSIFKAAGTIFGVSGVNRASISDITREAGVAQGTFYIHFKSKRELVKGYVRYISSELRKENQKYATAFQDRRDGERVGMISFFNFCSEHREIYRVIPEYEMVGEKVGHWYYKIMAKGYMAGLDDGIRKKEIRDLPSRTLAISLMGITYFIGLKWIVWSNDVKPKIHPDLFEQIINFTFYGLSSK